MTEPNDHRAPIPRRRRLSVEDYVTGVVEGNRTLLAQAITLVESHSMIHRQIAQEVLKKLLPHTGRSIRIGITGVPGAGKSTFIETFGMLLCNLGHRVAVLAVDPSSSVTRGSILGDKTRMDQLSRDPRAYVRPSPAGATLGGVARKTRETILVCEAAGFDVILVETVGVGQSEVTVRSMVDFFLLLQLTGAGDELQGMKKGVMELADAILINKADGDNKQRALNAQVEFNRILHFLKPATEGWETKAYTCSSLHGEGIKEIWSVIEHFREVTVKQGGFHARRQAQTLDWMHSMIADYLHQSFYHHQQVKNSLPGMEKAVSQGTISVSEAINELINLYENKER
ncbi:methylmalonyl Co-A mutase-associated GTPase MeaB [Ammoniphilus sp. CFH 90114]|uniref:methylmalonyl Co-A mutase-associated GTPase MeaB n=1 Tax=Ammoniphilus sp. CFH 90114 TaxID=2493665 RepID=UPI00100DCE9F|nr:methylmalonyl Co-A mutase-associated GTPase MeaB [Ammoniphilus sp. CFH 90114]RXT04189.1 methylmalonyl Co-A mutase-associated GTPase MeaB [Ammoniphilus sp. CFH 90114]